MNWGILASLHHLQVLGAETAMLVTISTNRPAISKRPTINKLFGRPLTRSPFANSANLFANGHLNYISNSNSGLEMANKFAATIAKPACAGLILVGVGRLCLCSRDFNR